MDLDDLGVILKGFFPRIGSLLNAAQFHPCVCAADRDDCICSINIRSKAQPRIEVILSAAHFEWVLKMSPRSSNLVEK